MGLFTVGFFSGALIALILAGETKAMYVIIPWFIAFVTLEFFVFRCPHCRKLAIFTPSGMMTPFVGLTVDTAAKNTDVRFNQALQRKRMNRAARLLH
jgi:hypothetical protein